MTDGLPDTSMGVALVAAREAAGMTVEQVSARTRIRATLVRDLEAGRTESSGATVYARGHLRAIAAAVGTDPGPLVALLDAEQGAPAAARPLASGSMLEAATPTFGGSAFVPPSAGQGRERTSPRWGIAVAVAAVVIAGLSYLGQQTPKRAVTSLEPPDPGRTSAPAPRATPVRTPAPDSVASVPALTGARLRVRLIGGSSWVSVHNAGSTLFEGVLANGQYKDFADPSQLKIVLGNAGAVDLNCGGRDTGPAGAAGKVLRFSCTKDGLTPA